MDFSTPPDYHPQAEKCMEWAELSNDRESELHWLSMAQAYLSLAEAVEKENPVDVWGGALNDPLSRTNVTRH